MWLRNVFFITVCLFGFLVGNAIELNRYNVSATISLKVPGKDAVSYPLALHEVGGSRLDYNLVSSKEIPVTLSQKVEKVSGNIRLTLSVLALEDIYFNFGELVTTESKHDDCLFYMPGFWYRKNLRSPKKAPSFHSSDSWIVREDRLSTPLTSIFDEKSNRLYSVIRIDGFESDAIASGNKGEVMLSGKTSVGYTGFKNLEGKASLSFGYPYKEAPYTYIRKLTLAPPVTAYQYLKKGDGMKLVWEIRERSAEDFADCVKSLWEYSYDVYKPLPVDESYTDDRMKEVLSNFFVESFVGDKNVKYYSGVELNTATCDKTGMAEVGFVGRTLLNAFNALEYGESMRRDDLIKNARSVFDSYLAHGFSKKGFFNEVIDFKRNSINSVHSIRRQSEGVYAVLYYLNYERKHGRRHMEWEMKIRHMLDMFVKLQKKNGRFPRKFKDNFSAVDKSGGSTASATLPLVMGYKYFNDINYLEAAKRSVNYLEKEVISRSDYFSSTLDANCEDKEASLYASTAAYYLALVTEGEERRHYADLAKKSAYFALSWYYTWDVPFAEGQMLGEVGLKTRGWGNVSAENNHIDVFVFDFADVLRWLSKEYNEPRFSEFADVMNTSMRQLLPYEGHMCDIAKVGFYPEVVQHTNWDYGKNGKGHYNDIFAPGWVVASLWELLTPGRAEKFLESE